MSNKSISFFSLLLAVWISGITETRAEHVGADAENGGNQNNTREATQALSVDLNRAPYACSISSDGRSIVTEDAGGVYRFNVGTGAREQLFEAPRVRANPKPYPHSFETSADGNTVLINTEYERYQISTPQGSRDIQVPEGWKIQSTGFVNNRPVAIAQNTNNNNVALIDLFRGAVIRNLAGDLPFQRGSIQQGLFVSRDDHGNIQVRDLEHNDAVIEVNAGGAQVTNVAVSSNGAYLAYRTTNGGIVVKERLTGHTVYQTQLGNAEGFSKSALLQFSGDGNTLLTTSSENQVMAIPLNAGANPQPIAIGGEEENENEELNAANKRRKPSRSNPCASISHNGSRIVTGTSSGARVYNLSPQQNPPQEFDAERFAPLWTLLGQQSEEQAPRIWGAMNLLSSGGEGVVDLIRAELRRPLPTLPEAPQVAAWIQELGSPVYRTRELASMRLLEALQNEQEFTDGTAISQQIREALQSADLEVSTRASQVIGAAHQRMLPRTLATARSMEILRRIGTDEANTLLQESRQGRFGPFATTAAN